MTPQRENSVRRYFADIWSGITSTYKGMRLTIRYFFRPKVTMEYPEVRPEIPKAHRGIHVYGEDECILCRACERVCPVSCITIEAIGKGKNGLITRYDIDYSKCIFCNLCCESCKPECINMGDTYDMATVQRENCTISFARKKSEKEIEEQEAFLKKKEEEREAKKKAALEKKQQMEKKGQPEER